jgi:hypothetical protein
VTAPDPLSPEGNDPLGPVPEDNLPGHHPEVEQDQPDLSAVAEKLGTIPPEKRTSHPNLVDLVITPPAAVLQVGTDVAKATTQRVVRTVGSVVGHSAKRFGDEVLRLTQ